jgi:hypothetical protein
VLNHGFRQHELVTVTGPLQARTSDDSWGVSKRAPLVGDVGTIVEVLSGEGTDARYVVECVAPDGSTIWLEDFRSDELCLVAT